VAMKDYLFLHRSLGHDKFIR